MSQSDADGLRDIAMDVDDTWHQLEQIESCCNERWMELGIQRAMRHLRYYKETLHRLADAQPPPPRPRHRKEGRHE